MAICFSILLTLFSFVVAIHGSDVTTSNEELSLLNLPKRIARCHSTNRKEDVNVDIDIRTHLITDLSFLHSIDLLFSDYVDVNPSAPRSIIMVHGWPGLWCNWLHQIYAFKVAKSIWFANYTHWSDSLGWISYSCSWPTRFWFFHPSRWCSIVWNHVWSCRWPRVCP